MIAMSRPTTPQNTNSADARDSAQLNKTMAGEDYHGGAKQQNLTPVMSQQPTPFQDTTSTAGESINSGLEKTKAVESPHNNGVKPSPGKSNDAGQKSMDLRTVLLLISVFLSMFLVGLDRTIISTVSSYTINRASNQTASATALRDLSLTSSLQAIPAITDEYHSLPDVGWYGSVYLLTCCAFQLLFGKIYTFFSVRVTLITSILIFEASSALCGAAPNSPAFIVGRAISGVGAAGIFAGTVSLHTFSHQPQVPIVRSHRLYLWSTQFRWRSVLEFKVSWARSWAFLQSWVLWSVVPLLRE